VVRLARQMSVLLASSLRTPTLKTQPLVSVVIATYNWSSVLRYAIASVLRQTYQHFEVLVIGDCCTDDSEEVVASFGDRRVRWHNLLVNSGSQGLPNNAGIERARGEIVAYLGHDDLWLPSHLAHLVNALHGTAAEAAYSVCLALGPPGSSTRILSGVGAWHPDLFVVPSALAHRRAIVDEIGPWKDYRVLVEPPDREFIARLAGTQGGITPVRALTVCKFPSAWRRDSYRVRSNAEQTLYYRRTAREPLFATRELIAYAWSRLTDPAATLPTPQVDPTPEVIPPGWQVGQYRKARGLPEHPRAEAPPPVSKLPSAVTTERWAGVRPYVCSRWVPPSRAPQASSLQPLERARHRPGRSSCGSSPIRRRPGPLGRTRAWARSSRSAMAQRRRWSPDSSRVRTG
jgi:Glycosyl transferase family 2